MKSASKLVFLLGGALGVATACGDSASSSSPGHTGGSSGRGGSAGSGNHSAGQSGKGATGGGGGSSGSGSGAEAGSTGATPGAGTGGARGGAGGAGGKGGTGAKAGKSGRAGRAGMGGTGAVGGTGALGGLGGQAGAGEGGSGHDAGGGGAAGVLNECIAATATDWIDATPRGYEGYVGAYETYLVGQGMGSEDAAIILQLFDSHEGVFVLGTGVDSNYDTCNRCIFAEVWGTGGAPDKKYFATGGELEIDASSDALNGVIHASLHNVKLTQVTIDSSAHSEPVDGGDCYNIASSQIDVDYNTGTGGAGGEGGGGGAPPLPTGCIEISEGGPWSAVQKPNYSFYQAAVAPNLGSADQDLFGLFTYANDTGTFQLGQGADASTSTCDRCFIVDVPTGTSSSDSIFFARGGTLEIDDASIPTVGVLTATATDVTFVDLESDACLHLASASISLP